MSFEDEISTLNSFYFLREFTYAITKFTPSIENKQQFELADNVIAFDDTMIVFQLKERNPNGTTTAEKWFQSEIINKGKKQIKDTISYLDMYESITVTNQQGHEFSLSKPINSKVHKIILYSGIDALPHNSKSRNFYISKEVGIIHIFHSSDYRMIVDTLVTITEIEEYLSFREKLIDKHKNLLLNIAEEAIIGQFLSREYTECPSDDYIIFSKSLKQEFNDWDIMSILHTFKEKTIKSEKECDYYYIFKEIAKLTRDGLKNFKERYLFSMNIALSLEDAPLRTMTTTRTGCGFVFYTCQREQINSAKDIITHWSKLYKYYNKLEKCVGSIFIGDKNGYFDIVWCYINESYEYDNILEHELAEYNPFLKQKKEQEELYSFHDSMMLENGCVIRIM